MANGRPQEEAEGVIPSGSSPSYAECEFFLVDEVAMMRFVAMCQESYTPDLWESLESTCRELISIRSGLRDDSLERIEAYLRGEKGWNRLGHPVLDL